MSSSRFIGLIRLVLTLILILCVGTLAGIWVHEEVHGIGAEGITEVCYWGWYTDNPLSMGWTSAFTHYNHGDENTPIIAQLLTTWCLASVFSVILLPPLVRNLTKSEPS